MLLDKPGTEFSVLEELKTFCEETTGSSPAEEVMVSPCSASPVSFADALSPHPINDATRRAKPQRIVVSFFALNIVCSINADYIVS
jgi:hypothetical protein